MAALIPIAIVAATVVVMEAVATYTHKYIMHGFGWGWHRSHHEPHDDMLERNDLFALVFAALAGVAFVIGQWADWVWWVGVGLSLYGLLYFILHDGLVHRRWPFHWLPRRGYVKHLVQAHRLHHAGHGRDGCVSFGFLFAPPLAALRAQMKAQRTGADGEGIADAR